jgi:hypothetical protein
MRRRLLYLALTLAAFSSVLMAAGFNKSGRTVMQFVKIGIGARQTALGESGIAAVRDVNAMFWNPAAISGIERIEAAFSYNRWFADMNYYAGAAGMRLPDIGILSFGYASLDYGQIQEALVRGRGTSADTRTGNTFGGGDIILGLSFAREFSDQLALGVSVKYLREKLFTYSTSAVAFDVGTYYDTQLMGIRFGMSFQNFGESVKFLDEGAREEGYDLPLMFRIGAAIDIVGADHAALNVGDAHRLSLSFEALNSNDYGERYHAGAEYSFLGFLHARVGYRFNYEEGNLSLGFGVEHKIADFMARLDYSYVSYEFLQSPHRITLGFTF